MSKGENRLKILYVIDILKENSREKGIHASNRYISASRLAQKLREKYDLKADRKSIYSYIDSLKEYGYNIQKSKRGYYLLDAADNCPRSADFETAELKLIADALSLSRFCPVKKTKQIIQKLEQLLPEKGLSLQNREIFLEKVIKSDNLSVIYNIDSIFEAINEDQQIAFHYQNVRVDKQHFVTELRMENGMPKNYLQSPYALLWKNECYYLLCYDSYTEGLRTFRVDRMVDVIVQNGKDNDIPAIPRDGHHYFQNVDIAEYVNTAFGMFGGEKKNVSLRVKKELAKVIADCFGKTISISEDELSEDYFVCSVNIQQSNLFFSWLSGFGTDIQILFPHDVREQYLYYLKTILSGYDQ